MGDAAILGSKSGPQISNPHHPSKGSCRRGKRELLPSQQAALASVLGRKAIALYMQMRLGKTAAAIRWRDDIAPGKPTLVVAPMDAIPGWRRELAAEGHRCVWLTGSPARRLKRAVEGLEEGLRWFIINYEGLLDRSRSKKDKAPAIELCQLGWDVVVLDESTRIRNPQAKTTHICQKTLALAPHKCILTGEPNPEGPLDFFEQMRFLYGVFMGCRTWWEFRKRYFQRTGNWDWSPKPGARQLIREAVRARAFFLRAKDAGMGNRKLRTTWEVDLPPKVRRGYEKVEADWELGDQWTKWVIVARTWLLRIAGGRPEDPGLQHDVKLRLIRERLKTELNGQQVVLWFRFNDELRAAVDFLEKSGVRCSSVTGGMTPAAREAAEAVCRTGKARVMCCQIKAARFGVDFSFASTAIYYSNCDAREDRAQTEMRIEHPLKREPLLYVDVIARDTVDEDLWRAQIDKDVEASFMKKVHENFKRRRNRKRGKATAA